MIILLNNLPLRTMISAHHADSNSNSNSSSSTMIYDCASSLFFTDNLLVILTKLLLY